MYAIIETGSKQYRVKEGDIIDVELIKEESGSVTFEKVLMLQKGNAIKIGSPTVAGVTVEAEFQSIVKDDKVIIYKYRKRKRSHTKNAHRQKHTRVKITKIVGG